MLLAGLTCLSDLNHANNMCIIVCALLLVDWSCLAWLGLAVWCGALPGLSCGDSLQVLEGPGSRGWGERYLADTHLCVMRFSCALFQEGYDQRKWRALAEQHAQRAHALTLQLQGPLSPDTRRSRRYVRDIDALLRGD